MASSQQFRRTTRCALLLNVPQSGVTQLNSHLRMLHIPVIATPSPVPGSYSNLVPLQVQRSGAAASGAGLAAAQLPS